MWKEKKTFKNCTNVSVDRVDKFLIIVYTSEFIRYYIQSHFRSNEPLDAWKLSMHILQQHSPFKRIRVQTSVVIHNVQKLVSRRKKINRVIFLLLKSMQTQRYRDKPIAPMATKFYEYTYIEKYRYFLSDFFLCVFFL